MGQALYIQTLDDAYVTIGWQSQRPVDYYQVYWSDTDSETVNYKTLGRTENTDYTYKKATHVPYYFYVEGIKEGTVVWTSQVLKTPIKKVFGEQLETLTRGLVAVKTTEGIFLSWRLLIDEVDGYNDTGLTGVDFVVYRNEQRLVTVTASTNYLDKEGTLEDVYCVATINLGEEGKPCEPVNVWQSGQNYIDIPIEPPNGGVTPAGEAYTYTANDMSVGDVDGDGDYEYIVKWEPTNAHDVSIKGYTGHCYIDCYKLSGKRLWRLDMGPNIRAGAHYTQFMVYDFDGDGRAEMSVKTAPGTKMTYYDDKGEIKEEAYITLPESDVKAGVSHEDNYVCSAEGYYEHLIEVFMGWHQHPEVVCGRWPKTLEACFSIPNQYDYPLSEEDATALVDHFIYVYAKERSEKNVLEAFEGFIYEGPEYLTMFGGDGIELETIPFIFPRQDDGLLWGDYAMRRIEPCNRVDRFLSGVGYLDGEHPYLIIARGYYTRACIATYRFVDGHHVPHFVVDSGHVPMDNPFGSGPHGIEGSDPVYGHIAGQGNHSLATVDVDGDGCQEIIYGACVIDHDGAILYSTYDKMPDGRIAKLGHGDAMHVGKFDPDRPGLQSFHVFEGGVHAPYGFALRDAEDGLVLFGEYAEVDLGRCMVGDIDKKTRGYQYWVNETYDSKGNVLNVPLLGTNQCIRWAGDMSTQILDGVDYVHGNHNGVINDNTHGIMLLPEDVRTNNGTKGNPCLVADIFGDYREELLLRRSDNRAIRIYTNTEISEHKLFTLMHDTQYRTSIAWQNNCYNQPGYTKFYYGSDMDWKAVLPDLKRKIPTPEKVEMPEAQPFEIARIDISGAGKGCKVLIGDVNNDGRMELICVQPDFVKDNRYEPHQITCVTAFDLHGNQLWQYGQPVDEPGKFGSDFPAQVFDQDGDGWLEVVCVIGGEFVVISGLDGSMKRKASLPAPDAHDCIVVANLSGHKIARDILVKDRYEHLYALDSDFNLLWTHQGNIGHFPWPSDINGDGYDEIMAGYDMLDHKGALLWSCHDLEDHADCLWIGDVNDDGELEVVVGGSVTCLYDKEGNELWRNSDSIESQHIAIGRFEPSLSGLQVAGLDRIRRGDGYKDQWDGLDGMFLIDSCGKTLWQEKRTSKGWLTIVDAFHNWGGTGHDYILAYRRGGGERPALYDGCMNKVVEFETKGYVVGADFFGRGIEDALVYDNSKVVIYSAINIGVNDKPSGIPIKQKKKYYTQTLYPGGERL